MDNNSLSVIIDKTSNVTVIFQHNNIITVEYREKFEFQISFDNLTTQHWNTRTFPFHYIYRTLEHRHTVINKTKYVTSISFKYNI
jgi:hypothetical protein